MSKYLNQANELFDKLKSLLDSFKLNEDKSFWASEYVADETVTSQYSEMLTDIKLLLFADSPQHPLYTKILELDDRNNGSHKDFKNLQNILSKYLQYRTFLEEED